MVTGKIIPCGLCGNTRIEAFINPYVLLTNFTNSIKIYNMFTGELIREKEIEDIEDIQVGLKFIHVQFLYLAALPLSLDPPLSGN